MALTPSTMVPLGTPCPTFHLPDVSSGQPLSLESFKNKDVLLVMFLCRHCPYVVHVQAELARIGREYAARGVAVVAISANDAAQYPDDGPVGLRRQASEQGFAFPYLYDDSQAVAKAFGAACTPDFFFTTPTGSWSTGGNWTTAGRATGNRSPAGTCAPPSTPPWPAAPRSNPSGRAPVATSNGNRAVVDGRTVEGPVAHGFGDVVLADIGRPRQVGDRARDL